MSSCSCFNITYVFKFFSRDTWYEIRESSPTCEWFKGVWFQNSTPKHSFMFWLAIRNRLATGDRLLKWNGDAYGGCVLCQTEVETRDHLFFSCSYSSHVWSALTRDMLGSRYTTRWDSLVDLSTSSALTQIHMFVFRYVFQLTTHSLWKERNGRKHGESPIPAPSLAKMIDKNMRNRLSNLVTSGSPIYESGLRYWFSTHCR
ncbi:putative reverse transcriptase zinc-binding domain-containing protein [Arabidopsis thaliana]